MDAPRGTLGVGEVSWSWEARPAPADQDDAPSPFLEWWEVRFRRGDDPEQEARVRAGVPPDAGWSDELLRSVLESARERTWRDADGELWTVRLEGWLGTGISTEVAEAERERRVVFRSRDGDREVRRSDPDLGSLTVAADRALQGALDAARGRA